MSIDKFNPRTVTLVVFIAVIAAIRTYLSMDPNMFGVSNFSAVGAMALFGGAYFNKGWKRFHFPIATLFISDIILQVTVFNKPGGGLLYGGWYYVYGAFLLMVMVGRHLRKIRPENILLASIVVVLIHWLITDFGVWIGNPHYPQTVSGYIECLLVAIPFEYRFLAGTIIYSAVMFGLFEWLKGRYPVLTGQ